MKVSCPCGKLLQIDERLAGKRVKCPACGRVLRTTLRREPGEAFRCYADIQSSQDGNWLLTLPLFGKAAGNPGRVEIWEVPKGKMHKLNFEGFKSLALSPDATTIAVAVNQSKLLFVDAKTGKEKGPDSQPPQK